MPDSKNGGYDDGLNQSQDGWVDGRENGRGHLVDNARGVVIVGVISTR